MKIKNKLKDIDTKNQVCYYFNHRTNNTNICFSNVLLNKKLYEIISVYNISYKTRPGSKPLRIRFDEING